MTRRNLFLSAISSALAACGIATLGPEQPFDLLNRRLDGLTKAAADAAKSIETSMHAFREAGGTHIEKVEIRVRGDAEPSRIARLVREELRRRRS